MIIDIVFVLLILMAIFKGMRRGLVVAVFSLLSGIIGLAAAIKLSVLVASHLRDTIRVSAKWLPILAFVLVFIGVVLLVRWLANLIQGALDLAFLGWANKLGGIILYAALYLSIYSVCLFYGRSAHILRPVTIESSTVYPFVAPWGPALIDGLGKIIPLFKDMFAALEAFFSGLAKQIG